MIQQKWQSLFIKNLMKFYIEYFQPKFTNFMQILCIIVKTNNIVINTFYKILFLEKYIV